MSNPSNLLAYLRTQVAVDVDSMDLAVAARHTTDSAKFLDMTSNQAIVFSQSTRPESAHVFKAACDAVRSSGGDIEEQVSKALDLLTVLLAKEVFPYLKQRVHVQTSPSTAYDTARTVEHAQTLVALFAEHGIPADRVCIKIPATPASLIACQHLEKNGIRTLGTCLFSVPQAIAASQAGCLYVAPYFNELRVHFEPKLWKEYTDTATQHPMAPVISKILAAFKQIDSKTLVMPASIVTAKEAVALASLYPDHLTLSGTVLDQLAAADSPKNSSPSADTTETIDYNIDFLTNGGVALEKALAADTDATRKLADALKIFDEMEQKTKELIRKELSGK
ncbi:aldolase [Amylocystis lapponica]|nr:aldolase [Amylocystis lapponica]